MRGGSRTQNKTSGRSSHSAMNFKGTVECFRFVFGILIFFLPENFLSRVLCARIFQKPLGQWNELASEKLYVSNALKVAELNPVNKFQLGPFESVDDSFYKSRLFLNAVDDNSRNTLEKMAEIFVDDSQQRKAGEEEMPNFSEQKGTINNKMYHMSSLNQALPRNIFSIQDQTFSPMLHQNFLTEINKMKMQIKKLKKLSRLMSNLQTNLQEFENSSFECLEKLLQMLESEEVNKATINNRFQIDSIFFINGLSMEDSRKEPDAQLVSHAMKEILNNLKEEAPPPHMPTSPPTTPYPGIKSYDVDVLKQLQKNFSKIFHNQDVTLEQINQISKIVDFVERYRGVVGNLKNLDLSGEEILRKMKKSMAEEFRGVGT